MLCSFFFFQAEDGIRDADVTGVQTCALPISSVTDVRVDAYREAASAGAVGTVTGHAREERLKPRAVERPLLGTVATLVPYSPALLARFEVVLTHARESANTYRASGRGIRLAPEGYALELLA